MLNKSDAKISPLSCNPESGVGFGFHWRALKERMKSKTKPGCFLVVSLALFFSLQQI